MTGSGPRFPSNVPAPGSLENKNTKGPTATPPAASVVYPAVGGISGCACCPSGNGGYRKWSFLARSRALDFPASDAGISWASRVTHG